MTYLPSCVYLKTAGHICILDPHQPRPQPSAIIYIQVKSLPRDENLSGTFGDGFYHQVFGRFGLTFRRILGVFFFLSFFSVSYYINFSLVWNVLDFFGFLLIIYWFSLDYNNLLVQKHAPLFVSYLNYHYNLIRSWNVYG